VLALAVATTLWIAASSDDSCAIGDAVTRSLSELVPDAPTKIGDAAAPGELVVHVDASDDRVVVRMTDSRGLVVLTRQLPRATVCQELGDSVGLVVERYLSDLGWRPSVLAVAESPIRPSLATGTGAPRGPGVRFEVAGRAELALLPLQIGGAAEVVAVRRSLELALELGGLAPHVQPLSASDGTMIGTTEVSSIRALAGGGVRSGRLRLTVLGGGERIAASATGSRVFQRMDRSAWQVLLRAYLGYRMELTDAIAVELATGVEARPRPVDLTVEGGSSVLGEPRVGGVLAASAIWTIR
jgi:hypothetical protein